MSKFLSVNSASRSGSNFPVENEVTFFHQDDPFRIVMDEFVIMRNEQDGSPLLIQAHKAIHQLL